MATSEPSYEVRLAESAEPPVLANEEWRTVDANGAAVSNLGRYSNFRRYQHAAAREERIRERHDRRENDRHASRCS